MIYLKKKNLIAQKVIHRKEASFFNQVHRHSVVAVTAEREEGEK